MGERQLRAKRSLTECQLYLSFRGSTVFDIIGLNKSIATTNSRSVKRMGCIDVLNELLVCFVLRVGLAVDTPFSKAIHSRSAYLPQRSRLSHFFIPYNAKPNPKFRVHTYIRHAIHLFINIQLKFPALHRSAWHVKHQPSAKLTPSAERISMSLGKIPIFITQGR